MVAEEPLTAKNEALMRLVGSVRKNWCDVSSALFDQWHPSFVFRLKSDTPIPLVRGLRS